jgi:ammonia channel protein AmtB
LVGTIPELLCRSFKGFAAITVAIICGSVVGRFILAAGLIFSTLWVMTMPIGKVGLGDEALNN